MEKDIKGPDFQQILSISMNNIDTRKPVNSKIICKNGFYMYNFYHLSALMLVHQKLYVDTQN